MKAMEKPQQRKAMEKQKPRSEGSKAGAGPEVVVARMPEEEIAVYRYAVENDYESLLYREEHARFFPGGLAQMTDINNGLRRSFKRFKEHSARRLAEYEARGYLEYCPPPAQPSAKRLKDKDGNKQEQSKL